MKLSILIPVYNEAPTIGEILRRVQAVAIDEEKEILVIDDGSTDGTTQLLQDELVPLYDNVLFLRHERNRGKGAALRTGLEHVTGDVVLIQDADLEYDPQDYSSLLQPIRDGRADVVYGTRFLGGPHRVLFFWHFVGNRFLTLLSDMLTNLNLTDMEVGYKVFRTEVLRSFPLRSNRFGFEPEVTAKVAKRGYRIYEVPITYSGRDYREGKKITWWDGVMALGCIIRYRIAD